MSSAASDFLALAVARALQDVALALTEPEEDAPSQQRIIPAQGMRMRP